MEQPEIVVVEDDDSVARLLSLSLSRAGYRVREAGSVAAAREILQGGDWDLLLLDRHLPDGDGIELCHEVRAKNPHGYILMLTGDSSQKAKLSGFDCGADDYVTKPFSIEELLARLRAGRRIVELQKELLASNRRLEELSRTDPLTGLANRRWFDRELATRFDQARRYGRPLSLAMIDVDHFKNINDQYGHPIGDVVLQKVSRILDRFSRESDFVARYGGEEFAVILPETSLLEGLQFAEKIRAEVVAQTLLPVPAQTRGSVPQPLSPTVSIGVASTAQTHMNSAQQLLSAADQALYRAKENGRNRVECERRAELRAPNAAPQAATTLPHSDRPLPLQ
jgi:diguanylate cyclase (GGDEF)-like protein